MMAENDKEQETPETITANELHVGTMAVDTLTANVYMDLAELTATLETQGKEQLRALTRLGGKKTTESGKKTTGQNNTGNGINADEKKPNNNPLQKTEITVSGYKNTETTPKITDLGYETVNRQISGLQQVESKRRIVALNEPQTDEKGKKTTVSEKATSAPVDLDLSPITPKPPKYDPATARKKRTIEIGAPVATPTPSATNKPTETPPVQDAKSNGYYVDANGRLRRPDGKYASKIEVKRYNRERNQDVDEKNATKSGAGGSDNQLGVMAKAFAKLTGRAAQSDVVDAAGVAAGGSYWMAAKEISDMASNFKESLQLKKINSVKDAAAYAKNKATRVGSVIAAPVRVGKRLVNRFTGKKDIAATSATGDPMATQPAPSSKVAATPDRDGHVPAPAKTKAAPVSNSKAAYEQGIKAKTDNARAEKQIDVVEANHEETQQVLEDILEQLKPKKASLLDTLLGGKKMLDMVRGRGGKRGSTTRTRRTRKISRSKAGALSTAGEALEDLADSTQGFDLDTNRPDEKNKGKTSKDGKPHERRTARTKGRRMPRIGAKAGIAKQPVGAISRVMGTIPKAMTAIPSVATAAGVTGGKILPVMETVGQGAVKVGKGAAAVGKGALELTGKGMLAGARALPLVGQALSVGLAGYDAYNGYNDTEAQKGIFNLKDGQEANTLQKSSTAAANVLDMGGLTSGLSGLLGDAAGYFGMTNTQEALTFDAGTMAKTMYDSVTGESARKAMGVEDGKEMSIGQNLASGAATVLDMGGLTSFLSKGIGSLVEDLGVTGAKDAMTFDAGGIAKTIYSPFSESGTIGQMATAVTEFSSDTIVGAINDLIDTVKRGDDSDTSINNFSSTSSWSGGGGAPASNWAGTAKGIDIPAIVQQQQEGSGLPDGYLGGVLGVESRGDPNAKNKSGAAGLWQFMPKTVAGMGGFNPFDPQASTQKMIEFTKQNGAYFQKTMGREATGRELYLMHQQGMGGGTKLMKNPDASAASIVGANAVTQNGGNLNMTARQFAELQMSKYDRQLAANQTKVPLKSGADSKSAKGVPPMLARPESVTTTSAIPAMLQRATTAPVDIQKVKEVKEAKDNSTSEVPQAPLVAKLDPAMTKSLSNIESLLKLQNKAGNAGQAGGTGTGRNSRVEGHDYVSGHMSDLTRDRR